jgi:hypothetical protein
VALVVLMKKTVLPVVPVGEPVQAQLVNMWVERGLLGRECPAVLVDSLLLPRYKTAVAVVVLAVLACQVDSIPLKI